MFEGNALHPGHGGTDLRELDWTDLVSRLAAAHDFRASQQAFAASFDADSARWIAQHEPQLHGEGGVNPEALGKCKWPSATMSSAMHRSASEPRPATRGME